HFSYTKIIDKMTDYRPLTEKTFFAPSREPPVNDGANEKQALAVPNHTLLYVWVGISVKKNYMNELRQADNKQLLQEIQSRLHSRQLTEKEVAEVLEAEDVGTEIRKPRPAVIISNDWQNEVSKRVIVLPFSTKIKKVYYPIELLIESGKVMCDQVKSIDKQRLGDKLGELDAKIMLKVDEILVKLFALQYR
ncbi:89_t:CDS:2, partial [Entrophospora sp. SA101]